MVGSVGINGFGGVVVDESHFNGTNRFERRGSAITVVTAADPATKRRNMVAMNRIDDK
jgi:hypothetical protein